VDLVVFEACTLAGWVWDLCQAKMATPPSPATDAGTPPAESAC
jgi:hypothetical protein